MKSSAKILLMFLIFTFAGVGFFFSSDKVLKFFSEPKSLSLKKIISYKPKDIKDKQALVELGASSLDEFTFFDTLNDPEMKKYIGLNGSIVVPKKIQPISENIITSSSMPLKDDNESNSLSSGFVLQVGSFQQLKKADVLKTKMIAGGYSSFIVTALAKGKDYKLYRVFVGNFMERIEAEKVAIKIKNKEKIESFIKFYEKNS
jgi:hypothetical protein